MKRLSLLIVAVLCGCEVLSEKHFTDRRPDPKQLAGLYQLSTTSGELLTKQWDRRFADATITIDQDGTYKAMQPTMFGGARPDESVLTGHWECFYDPEGWAVRFTSTRTWPTGEQSPLTGFMLVKNDGPPYELHQRFIFGTVVFKQRRP